MRLKASLISLFFVTLFFGAFFSKAFADTFILSGKVSDSSQTAISGATVSVNDTNSDTTTTDSSGNYSISIPSGTYSVQVTPPSNDNFTPVIALDQNISTNKVLNFVLVHEGSVSFSGHIYDSSGNAVPNQAIGINDTHGISASTTTDLSGSYSFQVTAGTYYVSIGGNNNPSSFSLPQLYDLIQTTNNTPLSLTQSTILDFTIPAHKVNFHVQDAEGNSVSSVAIQAGSGAGGTSPINQNLSVGTLGFKADNAFGYGSGNQAPTTDSSGNVSLWLLAGNPYTFIATPPNNSSYTVTTDSNVSISGDTEETITLQGSITLNGHIYDASGNPVANQAIGLNNLHGITPSTTTDAGGNYSFQVNPGIYYISIDGNNNSLSADIPQIYDLTQTTNNTPLSLTQNTTLDFTIPAHKITIRVQDTSGNNLSDIKIQAGSGAGGTSSINQNLSVGTLGFKADNAYGYGGNTSPATDSSGNVVLWLLSGSPYTFVATPPSGSSYTTVTDSNVNISGDTQETLILQAPVTLSGHIYDADGHALANQAIGLNNLNGITPSTTTDALGSYSFQVKPGNYYVSIDGTNNSFSLSVPQLYDLTQTTNNTPLSLTHNTVLDFTIPAHKVSIHVQDTFGNAVSGVTIQAGRGAGGTSSINQGLTIGNLQFKADDAYGYGFQNQAPSTDTSGNVTLWLLSNQNNEQYTFIASPPSGGPFNPFSLQNINITSNQSELISLQYSHNTPTTAISLSPDPDNQDNYSDPTTVTLSATAASGHTVANTYYTIDGRAQQTYTTPFTVTGNGSHTITYWSVDETGVIETHNSKTFTILTTYTLSGTVYNDANQNGFQDTGEAGYSGATVSLDNGQTTTTDVNGNYTFTGLTPATYTETLTLPNGYTATTTNPASISLSADTTENFGIAQASSLVLAINAGGDTQGNFVADTDATGGSTYSSSNAVYTSNVTNPAPQTVYQTVRYGNFSYVIPNLTANSAYTLRLHFNELYWGASGNGGGDGSRVFNVSVNGTQVLSNYDIYHNAGGANKAIVEQIPGTADTDGKVTIQFTTVTDNAMVNGIEIYSGTLPSPTPTATPTPVTSLAIDSGGNTQGSFVADKDFSGGQPYTSTASVDTTGVTNPAPEAVYQSVRYGNMTYTIPNLVPNSSYTVRLHFNELYWGTALTGNTGGEGSRVFNVSINANQVLTNFDIYQQAGGANKAIVKDFTATSDANGKITIVFTTVLDNAMVNGIELFE